MARERTPNETRDVGGGEGPPPGGRGDGRNDGGGGEPDGGDRFGPLTLAAAVAAAAIVAAVGVYSTQYLEQWMSVAFVAVVGLATLYVGASKRHPAIALGSGFYAASILLVLTPFLLYVPRIALQGEEIRLFAQNVSASNVTIGGEAFFQAGNIDAGTVTSGDVDSIIGLVMFVIVFLIVGLVAAVVGRVMKSYGASRVREKGARRTDRPRR